jgi:hypothetical protein
MKTPSHTGSIRTAEPRDAAGLARLLHATGVAAALVESRERGRTHILVLDIDGALRAAVRVDIDAPNRHARLQLLALDDTLAAAMQSTAHRMLDVGLALCQAYNCIEITLVPSPASGDRARPQRAAA